MYDIFFTEHPPPEVMELLNLIPDKNKMNVLEIGMNNYSLFLSKLFYEYTSIEPDAKIIQKFKYDCIQNKVKIPIIFNTSFSKFIMANFEKFNVIILINTFVFFNFLDMKKIFELLHYEGYCLIQIPRKNADKDIWNKHKEMFKNAKKILELEKNLKMKIKGKYFRTYLFQKLY